jgi:FkbM family methyltransferase
MNLTPRSSFVDATESVRLRPCRHGTFLFFPHDYYVGGALDRYGEYGEIEFMFLSSFIEPEDVVVEIGANIGTHTIPFAKRAGVVFAMEAQRILFQMLCANVALNQLYNVFASLCAGEQRSTLIVPPIDYLAMGNFGGVSLTDKGSGECVGVSKLDDFEIPKPKLIKIDVEGMETQVLRGAANTIKKYRPLLYVENDRPQNAEELIETIRGMDYSLWWHTPALFNPDNFYGNKHNEYPGVVSINMFCAPKELSVARAARRVDACLWKGWTCLAPVP